jgi:hypothetical protein
MYVLHVLSNVIICPAPLQLLSLEEWTQFESVEVATNAYLDHNRHRVRACAEALTHLSKSYFGYHVATQGPTPNGRVPAAILVADDPAPISWAPPVCAG